MSIAITGNPGVGKHTIAKELSQKIQLEIVDINQIAKDAGLLEKKGESNDVDTEKLRKVLRQNISNRCIIVGHLTPYVLDRDMVDSVIVLRRSPYDLMRVYNERGYSDDKSRENSGSEILGVIAYDAKNQFEEKMVQINVSGKEKQEILKKIESILSGNAENEEVDWLELVTKNDDLKKFFVN